MPALARSQGEAALGRTLAAASQRDFARPAGGIERARAHGFDSTPPGHGASAARQLRADESNARDGYRA